MVISQAYVKQFHTTGLVWAKTGGDAIMVARQEVIIMALRVLHSYFPGA